MKWFLSGGDIRSVALLIDLVFLQEVFRTQIKEQANPSRFFNFDSTWFIV